MSCTLEDNLKGVQKFSAHLLSLTTILYFLTILHCLDRTRMNVW